jgi:hypothetical protein
MLRVVKLINTKFGWFLQAQLAQLGRNATTQEFTESQEIDVSD